MKLTDRQHRVLKYMYDYVHQQGFVPTIREICDATDISSTSMVTYYMRQLEAEGYLIKSPVKSRAYRLTDKALGYFSDTYTSTDVTLLQQQIQLLKAENEQLRYQNTLQAKQLAGHLVSPQ